MPLSEFRIVDDDVTARSAAKFDRPLAEHNLGAELAPAINFQCFHASCIGRASRQLRLNPPGLTVIVPAPTTLVDCAAALLV